MHFGTLQIEIIPIHMPGNATSQDLGLALRVLTVDSFIVNQK
jgi:hypothetical protein